MKPLLPLACLFSLLTFTAAPARAEPPLAVPVEGATFSAELTALDADWQITFGSTENARQLSAGELVEWGSCAEVKRGPVAITADGGLLVADVIGADLDHITLDSGLFGQVELPLDALGGVVFDLPAGESQRDLLLGRIARAAGDSDRLLLQNGDEITGLIESIDPAAVTLRTDAGTPKIELDRIAALIFNPDLKRPPRHQGLRVWAGFADGSRLIATGLVVNGRVLEITAAGQTWKTLAAELVFLQPLGGRATYLSDLTPAAERHEPYLDLNWPAWRRDENIAGGRLRCAGRLYLKGIGVHSYSQLTYLLDRPYRRFQAALGIDDSTAGRGSVVFRVYVDRERTHTSNIIRGGESPVPISVDLSGAKRLDLIVDFADRADQHDRAAWLNARLVE